MDVPSEPVAGQDSAAKVGRVPVGVPTGAAAGIVAALAGAVLWAVLVSVTNYKIGYAAVGVGALVGLAAGRVGGRSPLLPIVAAVIAVFGCALGDVLADAHLVAGAVTSHGTKVSFLDVLTSRHLPAVYQDLFRPLDALFYVLAPVTAFRFTTSQQVKTGTLRG